MSTILNATVVTPAQPGTQFIAGRPTLPIGKTSTIQFDLAGDGWSQMFACYYVDGKEQKPKSVGRGDKENRNAIKFTPEDFPGKCRLLIQHMNRDGKRVSEISELVTLADVPVPPSGPTENGSGTGGGAKPDPMAEALKTAAAKAMLIGLVSITTPFKPETACYSKHWQGPKPWLDVLKECRVQLAREWRSQVPGEKRTPDWNARRPYADAGILVFDAFVPEDGKPTAAQTREQAKAYVASRPKDFPGEKIIEIGNEMKSPDYWPGTVKEFVELVLKPAYEVFSPAGYKVILGGLNMEFGSHYKEFLDAGAGDFHDIVGIHPYSKTRAEFDRKYRSLKPLLKAKDVWETESRVFRGKDFAAGDILADGVIDIENEQWVARLSEYDFIKAVTVFVGDVRNSATGPLGLFKITRDKDKKVTRADATVFFEKWFYPLCKSLAIARNAA